MAMTTPRGSAIKALTTPQRSHGARTFSFASASAHGNQGADSDDEVIALNHQFNELDEQLVYARDSNTQLVELLEHSNLEDVLSTEKPVTQDQKDTILRVLNCINQLQDFLSAESINQVAEERHQLRKLLNSDQEPGYNQQQADNEEDIRSLRHQNGFLQQKLFE